MQIEEQKKVFGYLVLSSHFHKIRFKVGKDNIYNINCVFQSGIEGRHSKSHTSKAWSLTMDQIL